MKNEEEKSLSKSKEIYSVKREGYENLLFIEELSSEDKNAFIKAVMEKDNLTEKINKYEELNKEINLIKNDISNKESYIGSAINFKGIRENIGVLLERYEDKLKELKFKAESYSSKSNIENEKLNDKFRKFSLVAFINIVVLILLLIFYRKNMLLVGFTGGILALILYKTITLKMQMSNEDKSSFNINSLEEDIRNKMCIRDRYCYVY